MNRLVFSISFLLWAGSAGATDFYVSSIHPSRSDGSSGTNPNAPWATFDKIKTAWGSTIKAGDTVHLQQGSTWTWSGAGNYWIISSGGSAGSGPITVRGDDYGSGPQAVLKRTGTGTGTAIEVKKGNYITFRGFTIDGGSAGGGQTTGIVIGGVGQSSIIHNIQVLDMTLQNLGNGTTQYICGIYLAPHNEYSILECLIEGNDVSGYTAHGLNHYPGDKQTTKHNNTLHNITWRNNHVHDPAAQRNASVNAGMQFMYGGSGNRVEYNLIEGPNHSASLFISNGSNDEADLVVRHNVLLDNPESQGILIYGGSVSAQGTTLDAEIYGNLIAGCSSHGINIAAENIFTGSIAIYNNTVYDNNDQYDFDAEVHLSNHNSGLSVVMKNNLIVHKASVGACLEVSSNFGGTFVHSNNLYWHTGGPSRTAIKAPSGTYTVAQATSYEGSALNTDPLFEDPNLTPASLSDVAGALPKGLCIRENSPAKDAGSALGAAYTSSLNIIDRPYGAGWDLGAFEFGSLVNVPNPPTQFVVLQ